MNNIIVFKKTMTKKNVKEHNSKINERDLEVAEAADRVFEALGRYIQGKETKEDVFLLTCRDNKNEQVELFLRENEKKLRALFDHNINAF